ncbi:MAG: hypothetical protein WDO13_21910 [Verrucomicrobiota bacterium]
MPDHAHWVVTFHFAPEDAPKPGEKPAPAPALPASKIDLIKTGDMMLVTVSSDGATPKVYYQRGPWIVTVNPANDQQARVLVPSPDHIPYPFYSTGFMLVDGKALGPSTFTGLVKYKDKAGLPLSDAAGRGVDRPRHDAAHRGEDGTGRSDRRVSILARPPPAAIEIPRGEASALQKAQGAYQAVRAMR